MVMMVMSIVISKMSETVLAVRMILTRWPTPPRVTVRILFFGGITTVSQIVPNNCFKRAN